MDGETIAIQDTYVFVEEGRGDRGKVLGRISATGNAPQWVNDLKAKGTDIPDGLF